VSADNQLGGPSSFLSINSGGTLLAAGTFTSTRTIITDAGAISVNSGQTLTLTASLSGGGTQTLTTSGSGQLTTVAGGSLTRTTALAWAQAPTRLRRARVLSPPAASARPTTSRCPAGRWRRPAPARRRLSPGRSPWRRATCRM